MPPHPGDIVNVPAARNEIGLVCSKCLANDDWSAWIVLFGVLAAAGQLARSFLSLPKGQNLLTICFFVIIGTAELFNPIAALAVRGDDAPRTSGCITPVT